MCRMPARCAAMVFSLTPPMGSTRPVSESSPVIAKSARGDLACASESMAVTIVIPADGPSLGVAPSGTCTCSEVTIVMPALGPSLGVAPSGTCR